MRDITETMKIKDIISSRNKKTNCFSFFNEICDWIEDSKADFYLINTCVFVFYKANKFYKFYYYVDNLEDIIFAKDLLREYSLPNKVVLEFTTKNDKGLDEISNTLLEIGFEIYSELVRLIQGKIVFTSEKKVKENNEEYELATLDNKDELLEIMHKEFDILKDDIPTEEELLKLISNKSIVIKTLDNQIVLIQIYEYLKGALYSRMTWIKKEYRKPKYTIDIHKSIDSYLQDLNIENFKNFKSYGWIDKSNRNLKVNLKMGAVLDGITCTIFLYKNN